MSGSRAKPRAHPGLRSHGGRGRLSDWNPSSPLCEPSLLSPPTPLIDYPIQAIVGGQKVCGLQRHKIGSDLSFFLAPVLRKPRAECPRVPGAVKCGQVSSSCQHTVNSRVRSRLARGGSLNSNTECPYELPGEVSVAGTGERKPPWPPPARAPPPGS